MNLISAQAAGYEGYHRDVMDFGAENAQRIAKNDAIYYLSESKVV